MDEKKRMPEPGGKRVTIEKSKASVSLASGFIIATHNPSPVRVVPLTPCERLLAGKENFVQPLRRESAVRHNFMRIASGRNLPENICNTINKIRQ